jgi:hypothetical protein
MDVLEVHGCVGLPELCASQVCMWDVSETKSTTALYGKVTWAWRAVGGGKGAETQDCRRNTSLSMQTTNQIERMTYQASMLQHAYQDEAWVEGKQDAAPWHVPTPRTGIA